MSTSEIISLCMLALAALTMIVSQRHSTRQDAQQEAVSLTTVLVKLDGISDDVKDVKSEMRGTKEDVKELRDRMTIVEQSSKQAHKRLDEHIRLHGGQMKEE